jgi:hypothetical protein
MKTALATSLSLALLFTSAPLTQRRDPVTAKSKRLALVIGNAAYKESPLLNPVNDARDISQLLIELGFEVVYKQNLSQADMKSAIREFGAKAATRLAANTSPEPVSNVALSLTEDVIAFGSAILMAFFPVVMLVIVAIFLIVTIWLTPKIIRALRWLIARLRGLFSGDPRETANRRRTAR